MVFAISEAELAAADDCEVDDYRRISVPLRPGATAWVYVFAGSLPGPRRAGDAGGGVLRDHHLAVHGDLAVEFGGA